MMLPLRRAFNPFRKQSFRVGTSQICNELETARCTVENCNSGYTGPHQLISNKHLSLTRFFNTTCDSPKLLLGTRSFASQAGTKSSGEDDDDDLEDGFSELETSTTSNITNESDATHRNEDDLISEPELSEEDDDDIGVHKPQDELELSDAEDDKGKKTLQKTASSELFKVILAAPGLSVHKVVDKWLEEGNEVTRPEIAYTMLNLRRRRMFGRALQLSEWLELKGGHEFGEREYASRLDLIAKVRGIEKAENYIQNIPKSFRGEILYRTLLANCVAVANLKKAEDVFNKMKDLGFPITSFACNQLLLLYKRCDKKKIADVLLLMEKDNVKPSLFTYKILIDAKGQSYDITGMEKIVETMKDDDIEPDFATKALLARHYISGGLKEKAESLLQEMEGVDIKENRWACHSFLHLYADLGKADEVHRIWKVCESRPRLLECLAAIEAWGKLKKVEEAEAVFESMAKKWSKLSGKHYSALLKVYANQKLLDKGKDLVKRMADSNCYIGPLTWDALVKLYVDAGEVEKADSILQKAAEQNRMRPLFSSFMAIMDQYSKRGDVHNTEKLFHKMRKVGYVSRIRQYQSLVQAYINAKTPVYGFHERMKADNIFPNRALAAQLAQVDPFKKTAVSDLLD
ncbi:pentatricopeptide repeat-containing protein At1g80270, mitochondrial-like [Coffea arabica]|uniref:Pentatricopeptide repeat-containing protein At1g80270, mitochondrial-like n=1 Tax=Coffea arabica TaxID=13443 RepID=A0A6P6X6H8_COFAR|nr:pentatricopeptide repeat-containing protein At1g80270, mitochondrial-like [Coffea arabica]